MKKCVRQVTVTVTRWNRNVVNRIVTLSQDAFSPVVLVVFNTADGDKIGQRDELSVSMSRINSPHKWITFNDTTAPEGYQLFIHECTKYDIMYWMTHEASCIRYPLSTTDYVIKYQIKSPILRYCEVSMPLDLVWNGCIALKFDRGLAIMARKREIWMSHLRDSCES